MSSPLFQGAGSADGDARVAYKNMSMDLRQYKKLKMFVHAEALIDQQLNDYDMTAFIRLGSDQTDNYYEYEVPLELTPHNSNYGDGDRRIVWPDSNLIEIDLDDFVDLKVERDDAIGERPDLFDKLRVYRKRSGKNLMKIKGTPNFSNIRTILIGVRNAGDDDNVYPNDGMSKSPRSGSTSCGSPILTTRAAGRPMPVHRCGWLTWVSYRWPEALPNRDSAALNKKWTTGTKRKPTR